DVGGYTVARTRQGELLDGPIESITVNTGHIIMLSVPLFVVPNMLTSSPSHPVFLSLSQFSRASLLNAAAAATLLLVNWMFAIVSAEETTSIRPALSPVARQPYGTIL
ncbi:hypothetical protein GOODEAATRI_019789, partial [Goodea atripinnis]